MEQPFHDGRGPLLMSGSGMVESADESAGGGRAGPGGGPFAGSNLLYLASQPYERIEVEVHCALGANVGDQDADQLAEFLRRHTKKPVHLSVGGFARPTQPLTQQTLALQLMQGPRRPGSAYLFVLAYDGSLTPVMQERTRRDRRPYTSPVCPHAIMVDSTFFRLWLPRATCLSRVLKGEAGHVLGLCANRAHGDGSHCRDRTCLMFRRLRIFGLGRSELCPRCEEDLANASRAPSPPGLFFRGPFLIRQENGYLVVAAPGYLALKFCPPESFDPDAEMRTARTLVAKARPGRFVSTYWHDISDLADYQRHKHALQAAATDTSPTVARLGRLVQQELSGRFGQPSSSE